MLRGIGAEPLASALSPGGRAEETAKPGLAKRFGDQLSAAAEIVEKAETSANSMAQGGAGSIETILALSRAELALRHIVSVRNRLLESYQEVMRLPL